MEKVWQIKGGGRASITSLAQIKNVLLQQRGVLGQEELFFSPSIEAGMHDPHLMADMKKAVQRISRAISDGEQILVYGDYDVDGVCSTAIMVLTLKELGAKVVPFLPHRTDNGYGLDGKVLRQLVDEFDLLITVDCGISNKRELSWLKRKGKDCIVTDHHLVPDVLPPAQAILHPNHPKGKYPFHSLCGAGVAWKLAMALLENKKSNRGNNQEQIFMLLSLACLGTVADMVPLVGENRIIVRYGLRALVASKSPGIKALVAAAGGGRDNLNTEMIAYRIAPLINAAGRIGHPQTALNLILAQSDDKAAEEMANLQQLNQERRRVGLRVQSQAEAVSLIGGKIIVAADTSWPAGVLGLAAGRLCDKYQCPAVIIGGAGDVAVGSARAPEGVNVVEVLKPLGDLLTRFGGHEAAAGFTLPIENIEKVKEVLAANSMNWEARSQPLNGKADIVLDERLIDWSLVELLDLLEPYGQGNEKPVFIICSLHLGHWNRVGKNQEHAKFIFNVNNNLLEGIGFGLVEDMEKMGINTQDTIDVLGSIEVNEYNGQRKLQINIKDVSRAGEVKIVEQIVEAKHV